MIWIFAADKEWNIGLKGEMLYHLPKDLHRFKRLTYGHTLVMGRRTLEALPEGKPLPGRKNIVLTRNKDYQKEGAIIAHTKQEVLELIKNDEKVFMIGGEEVAKQFLQETTEAYITEIQHVAPQHDTTLPDLTKHGFVIHKKGPLQKEGSLRYRYLHYIRKEGPMNYTSRDQIAEKDRWDLFELFKDNATAEKEIKAIDKMLKQFSSYKGKLLSSEQTLREAMALYEQAARKLYKLRIYVSQSFDLDTRNAAQQDLNSKLSALFARFGEAISWMTPEVLSGDAKTLKSYLKGDLKVYKMFFDDLLRAKKHTLSEKEEAMLASLSQVFDAPSKAFGMLNNADFVFPVIKDKDGNDYQLTQGSFIPALYKKDRKFRKEAFEKFYSVYKDHKNTLATLLASEVNNHVAYAKAKNFKNAREAALFENNIPEAVYDALIEAVHDALPAMYKYQNIRKQLLKVKELHMYDVYVPLVKNIEMDIPYDEGYQMVQEALKPLGEDYGRLLETAYKDRWIDVYETPGKRSGAYSSGSYDTVPYMLLNYQNTLNDVFTLAHELGHSMHTWHSNKNQPFVNSWYGIFLAEIASTFNEALLNHHLLSTLKDKKKRLYVINHYLESFKATLFRQTMFAEFERDIHNVVEQGGSLTSESLNGMYHDLVAKYFGPDVVVDEEIDFEWSRIPHFYYNFYVFQYATGMSAATAFAKRVIDGEEGAIEQYIGFLSAGRSAYPMEVLKKAGLDMTDPKPIKEALQTFTELVDEFASMVL